MPEARDPIPAHSRGASGPGRGAGPPPWVSVSLELGRALGDVLLFPPRLASYLAHHRREREELRGDLSVEAPALQALAPVELPRAPHIFVSCAEASGEIHALNTVRALREQCAAAGQGEPRFSGLGGEALRGAGVRTVGDPVRKAAMGFSAVLGSLPYYLGLLHDAARFLRVEQPDVCLFVDSPALHVPLGRIARRAGVPVVHFVAPQHWGWAPWRARSYRGAVDRSLTILPFEQAWFSRRGVRTVHVGHPLLDALAGEPGGTTDEGSRTLVLLPGSRRKVIERNLPWMLARLAEVRRRRPDFEVVLPHGRRELTDLLRAHLQAAGASSWVRLETGGLHACLRRARAAFSVSGTVLIDLLHHRLPTVVVYRVSAPLGPWMYEHLLTPPWFSSINLLAAREVVPEFCFAGKGPAARVEAALEQALGDGPWRAECRRGLDLAAERLGPAGASSRAAREVLALVRDNSVGQDARPGA
ncbi:MAG: hypothetical protein IPK67_11125 [Planctomycetes bacterium]|nr:hypothetical protein [Planctomycetota bacterium]